ncbi:MAG: NAD(P)-dependent glycerol-3-phosphate dehydrogenase [Gammaproteobacteria bacterium]|jgi:glycerol-3-phosphate dehydrogenase (NAD(P)+)|nr:NAD(P)-dependent glycerol-3-phosphate dehydrogenase [Gammaproteobacteria bacterium]
MSDERTCAVLGAGSWGTALAVRLALNGHETRLWGRSSAFADEMQSRRENPRYLPGVELPRGLLASGDLARVLDGVDSIVIAVPTSAFRETLRAVKQALSGGRLPVIIWATKGIEKGTGNWLHEVIDREMGAGTHCALLSGPSFAREVAIGLPTAVTVASEEADVARIGASLFHAETFRIYTSPDVLGVELGGAVKNVLAIAAGISDGLGFGANARAALITRGLHEIMVLGRKLGAELGTLIGLSGMGDLVLTCTDDQSRNRRFGLAMGRGQSAEEASREIGQAIEGRGTAEVVMRIAGGVEIELPICQQVYSILAERRDPGAAVADLLRRSVKQENVWRLSDVS